MLHQACLYRTNVVWPLLTMIPSQPKLFNSGLYWTGPGCACTTLHCYKFSKLNTTVTNKAIPRHTQHNHTKPNQAKTCLTKHITIPGYNVLLHTTLHCSKPVYTNPKSNHMVVVWWWWCGGGVVVYLIDYRTTPV